MLGVGFKLAFWMTVEELEEEGTFLFFMVSSAQGRTSLEIKYEERGGRLIVRACRNAGTYVSDFAA
jgi:hypothetical protein